MAVNTNSKIGLILTFLYAALEVYKRGKALEFGMVYMEEHHDDRGGALRVSSAALRFLNGDNVTVINVEADNDRRARLLSINQLDRKWYRR